MRARIVLARADGGNLAVAAQCHCLDRQASTRTAGGPFARFRHDLGAVREIIGRIGRGRRGSGMDAVLQAVMA